MLDQATEDVIASVRHHLTQRGIVAREWEAQSKQCAQLCAQQRAEIEALREELKSRTQDFIRLIEEAQALMRPQGEWEARESAIKQVVMEALESVDQELRAGATFDNVLLAVSARIALAWMDIEHA